MKRVLFALGMVAALLSPAAVFPDEALDRAISLAVEERYPEARKALDPLFERDPSHPRARLLDGILRAHERRVSEAIDIFDRLRRDHPDMSEPWDNLAVLYAAEGRFDEARESLLAALERKPSAIAYANLGALHTSLARRVYGRGRELGPDGSMRPEPGGEIETALLFPGASSPAAPAPAPTAESGGASVQVSAVESRGASAQAPTVAPGDAPGQVPAASGGAPSSVASCMRTGGFADHRTLAGAEHWLRSHGVEAVMVRSVNRQTRSYHQVYLPPFANRAEAAAKVREIRARGVRDVAVIDRGELANGISFGVFGVTENMRRRVAALERLGYPVRSKDNMKAVRQHVIEARTAGDPAALRTAWTERFPEHSIELVDCG